MVSIESLIPENAILWKKSFREKQDLLRAFVVAFMESGKGQDEELLYRDVMAREALAPTGLGLCCAIPHANSEAMFSTAVGVAVLEDGLDFSAADGQTARLVFFLAGPKDNPGFHLKLLSKIARFLHDNDFRAALLSASGPQALRELLKSRDI